MTKLLKEQNNLAIQTLYQKFNLTRRMVIATIKLLFFVPEDFETQCSCNFKLLSSYPLIIIFFFVSTATLFHQYLYSTKGPPQSGSWRCLFFGKRNGDISVLLIRVLGSKILSVTTYNIYLSKIRNLEQDACLVKNR